MDTNTTATSTVPPVDWKAVHQLDWSVPVMILGFVAGCAFFGAVVGLIGLFATLWLVWTGIFLAQYGIGAIFINPFYILGNAFLLAVVSWIFLTVFCEVTQAPTRIWRKLTR